VPDYVPADQVAALPDLVRPEVTDRMAILVVQGTTPGAGLTMRTQELVREYGLTRSAGATWSGTWQIISTVNARITARDWFVTRSGSPQHLNEVHQLRPLDDPLGVIPRPTRPGRPRTAPRSSGCPRARAPSCSGSASPAPTRRPWTTPSTSTASTRSRPHGSWTSIPTTSAGGSAARG
jgi:hypothetical protein